MFIYMSIISFVGLSKDSYRWGIQDLLLNSSLKA
jgi:hypothetical protein